MSRLDPVVSGLSLAITVGLLYLLCALTVAIAPGALSAALGLVVHGLNLAPLTQQIPPISLPALLVGLLAIMAYSFLAGLLFGLVNNVFALGRNRLAVRRNSSYRVKPKREAPFA
ncbi:MAG: DUF5676 family membrane protein [Burkholderiaceae bacterium]